MIEFAEIVKNTRAYKLFENSFSHGRCAHAFIVESEDALLLDSFVKMCAAFILCADNGCMGCATCIKISRQKHLDVFKIPEGKNVTVSDINKVITQCSYCTCEGGARIIIIDCSGILNDEWQNKLLKLLEEPPQDTYFFLTAPSANRLLATVQSRSQILYLRNGSAELLRDELIRRGYSSVDIAAAVQLSAGSITGALSFFSEGQKQLTETVTDFFTHVKNSKQALPYVQKFLSYKDGGVQILDAMTSVMHNALKGHAGMNDSEGIKQICLEYTREACVRALEKINRARQNLSSYSGLAVTIDNLVMQILEVKYRCRK